MRSKRQHAILRVRAHIIRSIRDFFDGRGFTLTDAPILHTKRVRRSTPVRNQVL